MNTYESTLFRMCSAISDDLKNRRLITIWCNNQKNENTKYVCSGK